MKDLKNYILENFNKEMYKSNMDYTKEMAEQKIKEFGYKIKSFVGFSHTNGASFYFRVYGEDKQVRVSDHDLTGKRAFEYIQIPFVEPKVLNVSKPTKPIEFKGVVDGEVVDLKQNNNRFYIWKGSKIGWKPIPKNKIEKMNID